MATVVRNQRDVNPVQYTFSLLDLHQGAQRLQLAKDDLDFRRQALDKQLKDKELDREISRRYLDIEESLAEPRSKYLDAQAASMDVDTKTKQQAFNAQSKSGYFEKSLENELKLQQAEIKAKEANTDYLKSLALKTESDRLLDEKKFLLKKEVDDSVKLVNETNAKTKQLEMAFGILKNTDLSANPQVVESLMSPILGEYFNESAVNIINEGIKTGVLNSTEQVLKTAFSYMDDDQRATWGLALLNSEIYGKNVTDKPANPTNLMGDVLKAMQNDTVSKMGIEAAKAFGLPDNPLGWSQAIFMLYQDPKLFNQLEILQESHRVATWWLPKSMEPVETEIKYRLKPQPLSDEQISALPTQTIDGKTVTLMLNPEGKIVGVPKEKVNEEIAKGYKPYAGKTEGLVPRK